jgi:hypothetical protein
MGALGGIVRRMYNLAQFPFMRRQHPSQPQTETAVTIPPALWIRDEEGALWTLGFDYDEVAWKSGKYEYDVVRNGVVTGQFARTIECRANLFNTREVRIWGADGWRTWRNGRFV